MTRGTFARAADDAEPNFRKCDSFELAFRLSPLLTRLRSLPCAGIESTLSPAEAIWWKEPIRWPRTIRRPSVYSAPPGERAVRHPFRTASAPGSREARENFIFTKRIWPMAGCTFLSIRTIRLRMAGSISAKREGKIRSCGIGGLVFQHLSEVHGSAAGRNGPVAPGLDGYYNYALALGSPVVPPTDMDAKYTRQGLSNAVEQAARNAGIALKNSKLTTANFRFLSGQFAPGPVCQVESGD